MGFVANGNNTPSQITISSDAFYPQIALDAIRETVRIDGTVTNERLNQIAIEEVIDVNRLLISLKMPEAQTLAHYSVGNINDRPSTDYLYLSAVANGVAAKVNEKYRSYDSSNSGNKRADDLTPSIDEYRRNKYWAIQQMLGNNHAVVELI